MRERARCAAPRAPQQGGRRHAPRHGCPHRGAWPTLLSSRRGGLYALVRVAAWCRHARRVKVGCATRCAASPGLALRRLMGIAETGRNSSRRHHRVLALFARNIRNAANHLFARLIEHAFVVRAAANLGAPQFTLLTVSNASLAVLVIAEPGTTVLATMDTRKAVWHTWIADIRSALFVVQIRSSVARVCASHGSDCGGREEENDAAGFSHGIHGIALRRLNSRWSQLYVLTIKIYGSMGVPQVGGWELHPGRAAASARSS